MKKSKIFMSLVASLPIVTTLGTTIALATGCACKKAEENKTFIPESMLDISGSTLKGLKSDADVSSYSVLAIPSSIKTIEANAFANKFVSGSTVNTVKFSKSIRTIGDNAFAGCNGITHFDLSDIDEEAAEWIDFGNNLFGTDNKPAYVNLTFASGLSEKAKKVLKDKLLAAGLPEASVVEKTTGHVEAVKESQTQETGAITKNEFVITAQETELEYSFVASADRDGGTPGVGVRLGEVNVTKIEESNATAKFKATVAAEIVNAKNNGDYVTYKVDMIAKDLNGNVKWVQTIENFKLVYNKAIISLVSIAATSTLVQPYVGDKLTVNDLTVNATYSDGTVTPLAYGADGYKIYTNDDQGIENFDTEGFTFETSGDNKFTIKVNKDGLITKTTLTINVAEDPYVVLPGTLVTNYGDEETVVSFTGNFEISYDGEQWQSVSDEIPVVPGSSILVRAKYSPDNRMTIEDGKVYLGGNALALLMDENGNIPTQLPAAACFKQFFKGSYGIETVSPEYLPMTTLTESCYEEMFADCISLVTAPYLPAQQYAPNCYKSMFSGCSSLAVVEAGNEDGTNTIFTCKDNSVCDQMFNGTLGGSSLFIGATPNKNFTYYYLDQTSVDKMIESYNSFYDAYIQHFDEHTLDQVTANTGSTIEGTVVSVAPVTYNANKEAIAQFPEVTESFTIAGISKTDFANTIQQYAKDNNMYCYADDNGLAYLVVNKADPTKIRIVRMDKYGYVKYVYDNLVGSNVTNLSLTWSHNDTGTETSGDKLVIYCWNDEFPTRLKNYWADIPGSDNPTINGVEVEFVIKSNNDGSYQSALDDGLLDNDSEVEGQKIDIFLSESDYISKYVESTYTLNLINEIGCEEQMFDDGYPYTKNLCTDIEGNLKGFTWQICPEVFVYRRSIAQEVFGTDNPNDINNKVNTIANMEQTGAELKADNYQLLNTYDDIIRVFAENTTDKWVDPESKVVVPDSLFENLQTEKEWFDGGLVNNAWLWSQAATDGMRQGSTTFGLFAPAWFIDFCMPHGQGGLDGDWAVCPSISNSFWGGTFVHASYGTDNRNEIKTLFERMANPKALKQLSLELGDIPNSQIAMDSLSTSESKKNPFLGDQNPYAYYASVADSIPGTNRTIYNQVIYDKLVTNYINLLNGAFESIEQMLPVFKAEVLYVYPGLHFE